MSLEFSKNNLRNKNKLLNTYGFKNPIRMKKQKSFLISQENSKKFSREELKQMGKTIKGEKTIEIEDGKHEGTITKVEFTGEETGEDFEYTNIYIKLDGKDSVELKVGVPTKITKNTALGGIIKTFSGKEVEIDKDYDVEELLKDKRVSFVTVTKETEKGKFANIIPNSLKLKE